MKAKKARQKARNGSRLRQIAALPFRRDDAGNLRFLLITSRGTQRFVIPKGWQMRKRSDAEAAAVEAMEEAGVEGAVSKKPVGSYFYWKRVKKAFVPVSVDVYPLEVKDERKVWLEKGQRQRAWVSLHQALALIDEPQLVLLMRDAAVFLDVGLTTESG
jgi:8-oxo-dGTP pyrophosphatase MutT (NUDIX family)